MADLYVAAVLIGLSLIALIVVLVAVAAHQRGQLVELRAVAGCAAGEHPWQLMTGGRDGFVRWYRCGRPGCHATRFVKGSER